MKVTITIETDGSNEDLVNFLTNLLQNNQSITVTENPKPEIFLKTIDELGFTIRTYNCLEAEGIFCVGDLVKKTELGLSRTPNLGKRSMNEIKERLEAMDLCLGMKIE